MIVEPITVNRLSDFVDLMQELHSLSSLEHLPFSRHRGMNLGLQCVDSPRWFGRVAVVGDVVVGGMCGYVTDLIFSPALIGVEEGIYVKKGVSKRAAVGVALLHDFVEWCKTHNVSDIRTGVISGIDNYAVDVFYRRNGFKRIGMMYSLKKPGGI